MLNKTVEDLIRIALAGGGLTISAATQTTENLIRIALAASGKATRMHLTTCESKTTEELIRIALAGKGCVSFE